MTDVVTSSSSQPEHLVPSELGTKEYWDALYDKEIANHASNPADIGTVWFDDSDAEAKMLLRRGDGGLFLITSCNWTEAELRAWFEGSGSDNDNDNDNGRFEFAGSVEYPSLSFGGVKGQTISTVCFVKKMSPRRPAS
ncbi:hypothetical protein MAPG_06598 [Magnaporthiopsis poae ATCC 64411]|uniref:Uncharacterized protein n=1 Tax=Magnaporthiopsis poae (strain ATCC 64411 / 73-15) TaxID=644358 RepID=A0A0C4E2G2_MAGP6|nr:hypothetical protein MAPG_06598 [Magnaporthiopsis poae ATCC 64411]